MSKQSKHKRQSLYFNEENLYLHKYISKKSKSNEFVLDLIRDAYRKEKGLTPKEEQLVSSLGVQAPTQPSVDLTQMMAQIQQLTNQVALLQTQPTPQPTPRPVAPVEPVQVEAQPVVEKPMPIPVVESPVTKPVVETEGTIKKVPNKYSSTDMI